jgi:hypothetical protein
MDLMDLISPGGQARSEPAGYIGVEHLQRNVNEKEEQNAGFRERARAVARAALSSTDPTLLGVLFNWQP